ncbi:MAG: arginase family protein [Aestuariivirga sp.]
MQLCLLEFDDAFDAQPDFVRVCDKSCARHVDVRRDGSAVRVWGSHDQLRALREKLALALNGSSKPRLMFVGSGDFHHVTTLLQASSLEHHEGPVTVIHVDNHPDWVRFEKGTHCGSWVNRALEDAKVEKVITLGVCSRDLVLPEPRLANLRLLSEGKLELYPYDHPPSSVSHHYGVGPSFEQIGRHLHWKTIKAMGEQNFLDYLLTRIKTDAVYLTIDKDVLVRDEAITNWSQGLMRLPYLLSLIGEIGARHAVIGADVIGDYSKRRFSGNPRTILSKHYEFIKKRRMEMPTAEQTARINSTANHALLNALSAVMA